MIVTLILYEFQEQKSNERRGVKVEKLLFVLYNESKYIRIIIEFLAKWLLIWKSLC